MKGQLSNSFSPAFNKWGCFVMALSWVAYFHCMRISYQEKIGTLWEFNDKMMREIYEEVVSQGLADGEMTVQRHAAIVKLALKMIANHFGITDRGFEVEYARSKVLDQKHLPELVLDGKPPTATILGWGRDVDGDKVDDYTHFTSQYGPHVCDSFNPLPGSYTVEKGHISNIRGLWITENRK